MEEQDFEFPPAPALSPAEERAFLRRMQKRLGFPVDPLTPEEEEAQRADPAPGSAER